VPYWGPQPGADKDAIAKHVPPYTIEHADLHKRYQPTEQFASFGRAFSAYAKTSVKPGEKKRLVNGKGRVIARQIG
jgi:hypothetical protein